MQKLLLLLSLLSVSCFAQFSTLAIPSGFVTKQSFHYKGKIFFVLDPQESSALNIRLMISTTGRPKIVDLPNVCASSLCTAVTDDVLLQGNMAYISVSGTSTTVQKTLISVDLDTLKMTSSLIPPRTGIAFFLPSTPTSALYFYQKSLQIEFVTAQLSLPSLKMTPVNINTQMWPGQVYIPFSPDVYLICTYNQCYSYNTNTKAGVTFDADVDCWLWNYIPSSQTLLCSQYDSNITIVSALSIQSNSVSLNQTLAFQEGEYPVFSAVNAVSDIAYIVTTVDGGDSALYTIDLEAFSVTASIVLPIPQGYKVRQTSRLLPTEGDGRLAIPLIPTNFLAGLPDQILVVAV